MPEGAKLRGQLHRLVGGMTGLTNDGRFDEPNIDDSKGDYISFQSWEWPQGVGLYGLMRFWQAEGDPQLLATIEDWYDRATRLPTATCFISAGAHAKSPLKAIMLPTPHGFT